MLNSWVEILPLFLVRILARKYSETFTYYYEGKVERSFHYVRPDIYVRAKYSKK